MTDEPDITEIQTRIMEALAVQSQEANFNPSVSAGISDDKLAWRLGISTEKLQEAMQDLIDRGFIKTEQQPERPAPRNIDDPWPSPMPQCRRCGKASDGLDHLCTRCRAIWACDQLVNDLTNALECFLDNRWSPHEYEQPRPAYYHAKPNFDGDQKRYVQQIVAAHTQLATAASRLVKLAMPPELRAKAETAYKPYWYGPDDYPDKFDGIHTAIEWGYAKVSSTHPIECHRLALGHLKDMVERREVLIPGEHPQPHEVADPNDPDARPWMGLTAKGVQDLAKYDNDEDDW
jgi:hypothetical protein